MVVNHPSAEIEPDGAIGEGTTIWRLAHLRPAACVGADCNRGRSEFVDVVVTIGGRCNIQNSVSVCEGVTREDDVVVGPSAVFTNDRPPRAFGAWELVLSLVRRGASIERSSCAASRSASTRRSDLDGVPLRVTAQSKELVWQPFVIRVARLDRVLSGLQVRGGGAAHPRHLRLPPSPSSGHTPAGQTRNHPFGHPSGHAGHAGSIPVTRSGRSAACRLRRGAGDDRTGQVLRARCSGQGRGRRR